MHGRAGHTILMSGLQSKPPSYAVDDLSAILWLLFSKHFRHDDNDKMHGVTCRRPLRSFCAKLPIILSLFQVFDLLLGIPSSTEKNDENFKPYTVSSFFVFSVRCCCLYYPRPPPVSQRPEGIQGDGIYRCYYYLFTWDFTDYFITLHYIYHQLPTSKMQLKKAENGKTITGIRFFSEFWN